MIKSEDLKRIWEEITYYDGGFLRLSTDHPLECYIGYQSIDQKTLLVVFDKEISVPSSSKSVVVTYRKREIDNRWTLSFELLRNEQDGVFVNLCCDLLNYSLAASNEYDAVNQLLARYKQWNRLLEYQKRMLLDESSKKGLIGELTFLQHKIQEGVKIISAVKAWVGAEGGDQDFSFPLEWYEVKTIGVAGDSINISSLEQLDNDSLGYLAILRIDKCAPERAHSFSLNDKVNELRALIGDDDEALALIDIKLAKCGYMEMQEYDEQKYYYSGMKLYEVGEYFPRITKRNIPKQIIAGNYTLSIAGIVNWEV